MRQRKRADQVNLHNRIRKLERRDGEVGECPLCRGMPGPLLRVEFTNGDEPVEVGRCSCGGTDGVGTRIYVLPDRASYDMV